MVLAIRMYGAKSLRQKALRVASITPVVRALVDDMLATMRANSGVGLAAEQIGRREAVIVIDITGAERNGVRAEAENPHVAMPLVLVNPAIVSHEGTQDGPEGCLSFPDIFVTVRRAMKVTATYTDLNGRACSVTAQGLLSRAIQHELDHLHGVLLVDRMTQVQKLSLAGRLKRLKHEGADENAAA